jgi:hypothetical protein
MENWPVLAPMRASESRVVGGVQIDIFRAGESRVKRMIYPPGFNWGMHLKEAVGTELCMHAHVGFLAHGEIHVRFQDGCVDEFKAPVFVAVEPGHEGWVVGDEPAVLIEFDFEGQTVDKLKIPRQHQHDKPERRIAHHTDPSVGNTPGFTEGSALPGSREKYPFTK